jgi:hypothetical protein
MAATMINVLGARARQVLKLDPDPIVRVRLERDVLRRPANVKSIAHHPHVLQLAAEQRRDGGWGRFHSRDSSRQQCVATTEAAVQRALELGLDAHHPILRRASRYIAAIVRGKIAFPESEKNARWPVGVRLFAASTLAQIEPDHHAVTPVWQVWHEIAQETFARGTYDAAAEAKAHRRLHGLTSKVRYLELGNKYAVALLAARGGEISPRLQKALLRWLFNRPEGLGYLTVPLQRSHAKPQALALVRALEIVSGFPKAVGFASPALQWLWNQTARTGMWNFGRHASWCEYPPLSFPRNRSIDDTTRVLCLWRRYHP